MSVYDSSYILSKFVALGMMYTIKTCCNSDNDDNASVDDGDGYDNDSEGDYHQHPSTFHFMLQS